jgi:hypothetical protein
VCRIGSAAELLLAAPAQSLERWLWPAVLAIVFAPHLGPDLAGEGAGFSEMLVGYSDSESDNDDDAPAGPSLPAPRPADGAEDDDGDDAADGSAQQPVVPVALAALDGGGSGSGSDDDDDAAAAAAAAAEAAAAAARKPALALPPPDLDFDASRPGGPAVAAPRVTALSGTKRKGSASAHIARGFTAAVPRSDALAAAQELEEERQLEERARNGGLSSAYDSVFRVAESELSAEELDRRSRVRVGKKGNARTISKKEAAREAAFEATLR